MGHPRDYGRGGPYDRDNDRRGGYHSRQRDDRYARSWDEHQDDRSRRDLDQRCYDDHGYDDRGYDDRGHDSHHSDDRRPESYDERQDSYRGHYDRDEHRNDRWHEGQEDRRDNSQNDWQDDWRDGRDRRNDWWEERSENHQDEYWDDRRDDRHEISRSDRLPLQRVQRDDRSFREDRRSHREDRHPRDDRPPREERSHREDRTPRGDRPPRDERSREDRYPRENRHPREDRSHRDDQERPLAKFDFMQEERSNREDRPRRDDRAPRDGRDDRSRRDHHGRDHRHDRGQDDRSKREDQSRHARGSRDDRNRERARDTPRSRSRSKGKEATPAAAPAAEAKPRRSKWDEGQPGESAVKNLPDWLSDLAQPHQMAIAAGLIKPPQTKIMKLTSLQIRFLLGKGGETIKGICDKTGAEISVDSDHSRDEGMITIVGDVDKTVEVIRDVMTEKGCPLPGDEVEDPADADLQIPGELVGMFIGKGGENVKRIREECGGNVFIGVNAPSEGVGHHKVVIVGNQREKARELIKQRIKEVLESEMKKKLSQAAAAPVATMSTLAIPRVPAKPEPLSGFSSLPPSGAMDIVPTGLNSAAQRIAPVVQPKRPVPQGPQQGVYIPPGRINGAGVPKATASAGFSGLLDAGAGSGTVAAVSTAASSTNLIRPTGGSRNSAGGWGDDWFSSWLGSWFGGGSGGWGSWGGNARPADVKSSDTGAPTLAASVLQSATADLSREMDPGSAAPAPVLIQPTRLIQPTLKMQQEAPAPTSQVEQPTVAQQDDNPWAGIVPECELK